jgi:hypothetical protein
VHAVLAAASSGTCGSFLLGRWELANQRFRGRMRHVAS